MMLLNLIYQPDDEIHNRHSRRYANYKFKHNIIDK